ncbi:hypothetical protein L596_021974 [Steinernema carpocapsae]|uniref:Uncharacterized protein n=1 Tax=Steinernema carpocapsae TaxID=34508 RepID=A0A4U5MKF9_STECR|nr:hypothetical protein L596_021974 [Steinernema carpocapsae]
MSLQLSKKAPEAHEDHVQCFLQKTVIKNSFLCMTAFLKLVLMAIISANNLPVRMSLVVRRKGPGTRGFQQDALDSYSLQAGVA